MSDFLRSIGFYTLTDQRALHTSPDSPFSRCELLLTNECNFRCSYCRRSGPQRPMTFKEATHVIEYWAAEGLENVRFSGGEPTLWPDLVPLVAHARAMGIIRIALSTNGSASRNLYQRLFDAGVNDFSISLDAHVASVGDSISSVPGSWSTTVSNLAEVAALSYTTVGVVVTRANVATLPEIISLAHRLGVADIRVITAAQEVDLTLSLDRLAPALLDAHPILRYRLSNKRPLRGLLDTDNRHCPLVLDDMAVSDGRHYPCIIYLREGGKPIGPMDSYVRLDRAQWAAKHDCHSDPICSANCLDVCVEYNNRVLQLGGEDE